MPDRECAVDGCDDKARARGWCSTHYRRWRESGDPGPAEKRRYGTAGCSVDGCDKPHFRHGMCRPHDRAVQEYGTPTPRRRGEVVDGKRICPRCKADRPLSEWGAASICKACNIANAKKYYKPVEGEPASCAHCGQAFRANKRRSVFCSVECTEAGRHRRNAKHVQARRARERAATVEDFRPEDVYERDRWICGLCGEPIDRTAVKPHPRSRSIDHVVPISLGGHHSLANTQAAHLGCNARKGARLDWKAV